MACKRWIEAPVNGGRNYNGPKVHCLDHRLSEIEFAVKMRRTRG